MADIRPDDHMNGDTASLANGSASATSPTASHAPTNKVPRELDDVLHSDIGLVSLLDRLKQSIASAKDFAAFLKKRSSIEEEHAKDLRRLAKSTSDTLHRNEFRQGTYSRQLEQAMNMHERLADNGMQFALSLHQMHEDLNELSNNMERGRKNWKHEGLDAEKRASDAENMMQRAKAKYDSLADDLDRAKTGDIKGSRRIMKGPKSAAQHEEDLARKLQAADTDYNTKVHAAKSQRAELINSARPRAVKALQELINECDSALALQLQKFATFNEKLFLGNGILITPLPNETSPQRSLRDLMNGVDNEKDFHSYILGLRSKVPPKPQEIRYEQHHTLLPKQQMPAPSVRVQQHSQPQPQLSSNFASPTPAAPSISREEPPSQTHPDPFQNITIPPSHQSSQSQQPPQHGSAGPHSPLYSQGPPHPQPRQLYDDPPYPPEKGPVSMPSQPPSAPPYNNGPIAAHSPVIAQAPMTSQAPPPIRPVFGVDLEALFQRDGTAVPMVVYQCMQAVDLFGLDVEGIYRLSGTATHVAQLKANFDHDSSRVDFRNPASFHHDVNSVAGLLKSFFRDLPDPLLTRERYGEFISAARIEDDIVRRDTLHAVINGMPDANYATLRALVLHLNRVQDHFSTNRMSSSNLAICFAPSLMGSHTGPQIADAALQARVVDTILNNTYQIFDED